MNLCATFSDLAHSTWDRLGRARSVSFQIKEETLTDLLLLHFKTLNSVEIITQEFNRNDERETGADWEWWFVQQEGQAIGIRVQAKVINFESNSFPHLHYAQKRKRFNQCDQLIRSALEGEHATIPLYCLYTHWNGPSEQYLTKWNPHETHGCSLLSAFQVREMRKEKISDLATLLPGIVPWHALVCGDDPNDDLPFRVWRNWKENFLVPEKSDLFMTYSPDIVIDEETFTAYKEVVSESEAVSVNRGNVKPPRKRRKTYDQLHRQMLGMTPKWEVPDDVTMLINRERIAPVADLRAVTVFQQSAWKMHSAKLYTSKLDIDVMRN